MCATETQFKIKFNIIHVNCVLIVHSPLCVRASQRVDEHYQNTAHPSLSLSLLHPTPRPIATASIRSSNHDAPSPPSLAPSPSQSGPAALKLCARRVTQTAGWVKPDTGTPRIALLAPHMPPLWCLTLCMCAEHVVVVVVIISVSV